MRPIATTSGGKPAELDRGWVIANHKLVSFHAAFLTSLLSISSDVASRVDVVRQMFWSLELPISLVIWYLAWHVNIAIHEMGHYLAAVRTNNLRPELDGPARRRLEQGAPKRWFWYLEMLLKIPYGAFRGVNKEAGSFHPSVKSQNLAVSAAGPRASKLLSLATLPPGVLLVALGLYLGDFIQVPEAWLGASVYAGRLLFTVGVVALFDFMLADPGMYAAFKSRQSEATQKSRQVRTEGARGAQNKWHHAQPAEIKRKLEMHRLQEITLSDDRVVFAPWEFRNSIMGGRHTEEIAEKK